MASTLPVADVSSNGNANANANANGEGSSSHPYTLDTLKQHTKREDLWLLLHDKVYNVTQFLDEHPGGDEVLLEEAGRDATEAFEDVGHSDEARSMLPKMLLGEFHGPKSSKAAAKKVAASSSTSGSSSGGFPLWVIPAALIAAYLAWRLLYAK